MTRARVWWIAGTLAVLLLAGGWAALLASRADDHGEGGIPRATVTVGTHTLRVTVADTHESRARGLAGVTTLADDEGMLFVPDGPSRMGIWMRGMVIPIDIVWIADGRVVHVVQGAKPDEPPHRTYEPPVPVDHVLEGAAGMAARVGLRVGAEVTIGQVQRAQTAVSVGTRRPSSGPDATRTSASVGRSTGSLPKLASTSTR